MSEALAEFRPYPAAPAPARSTGTAGATVTALATPELRSGTWTRYGDSGVLADQVTEHALTALAETTRSAARSQGYAVGWAEGRRDAEAAAHVAARRHEEELDLERRHREDEHRSAIAALESAAAQLVASVEACRRAIDERATDLALELTGILVGAAVERETDADVVRRVLDAAPQQPGVTVRINSRAGSHADLAELTAQGITVVADPSLDHGDALVETDERVVDLRLGSALARIQETLR